jgi:hypothetical protein
LTFKKETKELWIGTAERTQKLQYNQIREVISEKIPKGSYAGAEIGEGEYWMVGLQLGILRNV